MNVKTFTSVGTQVGDSDYDAIVTVPHNASTTPSVTLQTTLVQDPSITYSGEALQNYTKVRITALSVVTHLNATLTSAAIVTTDGATSITPSSSSSSDGETTYTFSNVDIPMNTAGTFTLYVTATDSRSITGT